MVFAAHPTQLPSHPATVLPYIQRTVQTPIAPKFFEPCGPNPLGKGKKDKNKGIRLDPAAIPCIQHVTGLLTLLTCINRDKLLAAHYGALPLLRKLVTAQDLRTGCSSYQVSGLIALM